MKPVFLNEQAVIVLIPINSLPYPKQEKSFLYNEKWKKNTQKHYSVLWLAPV